ncbi:hypothetical protein SLEP1_g19773 [Rubroshorea leprosula]|uniref:Scarecrow-like protein 33 n=1 Tax=Rubroshorea leprosula TaxID=152421 RepID=A0AAV5J825_9ROSI|nr:hypothetical protein SLEP1_g19773 [Rubroshorea leprosula]
MDRNEFSDYINDFGVGEDAVFPNSDQFTTLTNGFNFNVPSPDLSFMDVPFVLPNSEPASFPSSSSVSPVDVLFSSTTGWSPEGESSSPSDDSEASDPVLKYISQILMEENMQDKPWEDPLALRDTEQSLYQVLGEQYPPPINQPQPFVESPDTIISGSSNDYVSNNHSSTIPSTSTSTGTDNPWVSDVEDHSHPQLQASLSSDHHFQSNSNQPTSKVSVNSTDTLGNGLLGSAATEYMVQNMFTDMESVLQFQRGFEEASKFLPSGNQLIIDVKSNTFAPNQKEVKNEKQQSPDGSRARKNHEREDRDLEEGRSTKQSAVYVEESELSELFDKVLLYCKPENSEAVKHKESGAQQKNGQPKESSGGKSRSKRRGKKKETIDLRTLLALCAQAVSSFDRRTAGELLKQIRENSSPFGDGSQRLAHYFANGLEARLDGSGTGTPNFFGSLTSKKTTAADVLNAHKVHFTACPFKKLAFVFANKMICKMAEKATALHIVDFGILFGFQWPLLIQLLSMRAGGPPKLRITGIELPQRGLRPAERIEETGRRLKRYCERFNVPFEYNSMAVQNWETIRLEDLKIDRNEMLAVNNHGRFESLLDETTEVDCPRNDVLKLIRSMNPDIVVHQVVNGSYNAPFFVSRFREALFHFSAIYDIFDTTIPREEPARLMIENEFHGREVMNVVACEGSERVQRPETYKQWQVRNIRVGFKPLPVDQELMQILRHKLKTHYHNDFVIDEDGHWMLQGWKGRIVYACSCWVSAEDPDQHAN